MANRKTIMKLSDSQLIDIRWLYHKQLNTLTSISKKYDFSLMTISKLVDYKVRANIIGDLPFEERRNGRTHFSNSGKLIVPSLMSAKEYERKVKRKQVIELDEQKVPSHEIAKRLNMPLIEVMNLILMEV